MVRQKCRSQKEAIRCNRVLYINIRARVRMVVHVSMYYSETFLSQQHARQWALIFTACLTGCNLWPSGLLACRASAKSRFNRRQHDFSRKLGTQEKNNRWDINKSCQDIKTLSITSINMYKPLSLTAQKPVASLVLRLPSRWLAQSQITNVARRRPKNMGMGDLLTGWATNQPAQSAPSLWKMVRLTMIEVFHRWWKYMWKWTKY